MAKNFGAGVVTGVLATVGALAAGLGSAGDRLVFLLSDPTDLHRDSRRIHRGNLDPGQK